MKLLLCLAFVGLGLAMPSGSGSMDKGQIMDYLKRFGYMGEESPMFESFTDEEAYPKAIAEFQTMAGLPRTGEVDEETMKMMILPRCGNKDMESDVDAMKRRKKRFTLARSKWLKGQLTYRISQYTNDLDKFDVDKVVATAFKMWSTATNLDFRQSDSSQVDIKIAFVPRVHGDDIDFDGPGLVLGHAFLPRAGDVHMDEDETWTLETDSGTDLFQVIAHELGHSLGLGHSRVKSALMYPFYRGYDPALSLDQDDIKGIQQLYGVRATTPRSAPPTPGPLPPVDPGIASMPCSDGRVDAILMTEDRTMYAFRQNYYMVIDNYGIAPSYPRRINEDWQGLPDDLDAAINFETVYAYVYTPNNDRYSKTKLLDERIFFFKGSRVYLYEAGSKSLSDGYPKAISEAFPGLPDDIDAAFRWGHNNKPYFMKDDEYYRYSNGPIVSKGNGVYEEAPGMVDANYPRDLDKWHGLSDSIDAVFVWQNDRTYFFKDDLYYRFNDLDAQVDCGYPLSTRGAWFGCSVQGTETVKMEADMTVPPRFDVMTNGSNPASDCNRVSGQGRLQSCSLASLISLLIVLVLCK